MAKSIFCNACDQDSTNIARAQSLTVLKDYLSYFNFSSLYIEIFAILPVHFLLKATLLRILFFLPFVNSVHADLFIQVCYLVNECGFIYLITTLICILAVISIFLFLFLLAIFTDNRSDV